MIDYYEQCLRSDPEYKSCKEGSKLVRSINKRMTIMEDGEEKDKKVKIEAAEELLKIKNLPVVFTHKAKNALCNLYTENKEYDKAEKECRYIITIEGLEESIDVEDAYCNIATGYMAADKFDDAKRIIQEGLQKNQRSQKVD